MFIQDDVDLLSHNQVITGGVGGATGVASDNALDLAAPLNTNVIRALGAGTRVFVEFIVREVSGGDGSDTFQFHVVVGPDISSQHVDLSVATRVASTPVITGIAQMPVGTRIVLEIPSGALGKRYIGANFVITADAVLTMDARLMVAGFGAARDDTSYPSTSGYNDDAFMPGNHP